MELFDICDMHESSSGFTESKDDLEFVVWILLASTAISDEVEELASSPFITDSTGQMVNEDDTEPTLWQELLGVVGKDNSIDKPRDIEELVALVWTVLAVLLLENALLAIDPEE